jgi:hypothetical protein
LWPHSLFHSFLFLPWPGPGLCNNGGRLRPVTKPQTPKPQSVSRRYRITHLALPGSRVNPFLLPLSTGGSRVYPSRGCTHGCSLHVGPSRWTSLRAPRVTPTPRLEGFRGRPRASDKILDEKMGGRGVGVNIPAPTGAGISTPTPRRAIFSPAILSGPRGRPPKTSGRGVWVIRGARTLVRLSNIVVGVGRFEEVTAITVTASVPQCSAELR